MTTIILGVAAALVSGLVAIAVAEIGAWLIDRRISEERNDDD